MRFKAEPQSHTYRAIRLGILEDCGRLALNRIIAYQPAAAYHNSLRG